MDLFNSIKKILNNTINFKEFNTLQELNESSFKLKETYPHLVTIQEIGLSLGNENIYCITIGNGSRKGLLFSNSLPWALSGSLTLDYLSWLLVRNDSFRNSTGYKWYIIKTINPDELKLNESWIKGPFNPINFALRSYDSIRNIDNSFPVINKFLPDRPVPPETRTLMNIIDIIKPDIIINLENNIFDGALYSISEGTPELYKYLYDLIDTYNIPIRPEESEVEFLYSHKSYGESWKNYGRLCNNTFCISISLPYFSIPQVQDMSISKMTYEEIYLTQKEIYEEYSNLIREIYDDNILEDNNPFKNRIETFLKSDFNNPSDKPVIKKKALKSDEFRGKILERFNCLLELGNLRRAIDWEIKNFNKDFKKLLLKAGEKCLSESKFLIENLDYSILPIKNLVIVQIGTILHAIEYRNKYYKSKNKTSEFYSKVDLCQYSGHTCCGCCYDLNQDEEVLKNYLRENTAKYKEYFKESTVTSSGLEDYILMRQSRIKEHSPDFYNYNCPFSGYLYNEKTTGCLIHPVKYKGRELRELYIINCSPKEQCYRSELWEELPDIGKKEFKKAAKHEDSFGYAKLINNLIPELYVKYTLRNDIRNNKFFHELINDYDVFKSGYIKKNLHLLDELREIKKINFLQKYLEEKFLKFGQPFLDYCLNVIEKKWGIGLILQEIPKERLRKGNTNINGHINYLVFCQATIDTNKTIVISASYDNTKHKLSDNCPENARTIAFLIILLKEVINMSNRKVNYLFTFLGADNDSDIPLTGSYYFSDILKSGLDMKTKKIFPPDILCQIFLIDILQGEYYGKLILHSPVSQKRKTFFEDYICQELYNDEESYDKTVLSDESIRNYIAQRLETGKLLDILKDVPLVKSVIESLKELKSFTRKDLLNIYYNKLEDKFLAEKVADYINKVFIYLDLPRSSEELKTSLVDKGLLKYKDEKYERFYIKPDEEYTNKLCSIMENSGFTVEDERIGRQIGLYPLGYLNIPTIGIEGIEKKDKDIKYKNLKSAILKFLYYLQDNSKINPKNYIIFPDC